MEDRLEALMVGRMVGRMEVLMVDRLEVLMEGQMVDRLEVLMVGRLEALMVEMVSRHSILLIQKSLLR